MAENRPKPLNPAPPLNDVDYFDYFKSQKDGRVYDDFGQSWEKFDIKLFDSITHYNILQVYKFMVNKRIEHFKRYDSLSKVAKEKDQKIKAFENQKLEADNKERMENTKLKSRIKELEDLWKQNSDDGKIVELKEEINQLKADIQKYRERRDSDKNQLKENRENLKKADAEIKELKNKNQLKENRENLKKADAEIKELKNANRKLESDLIAANNSMKQLENRNKNLKSDLNAANESIKIFQINQNEKAEETQNEMNQLKANFNAKNMKLKNVLIHLKSVEKELTKIKQKCQSYEESNEQQSEIIEQLQKALTCSSDQNEKLKDDLLAAQNALKKLKDGKTKVLNKIAQSLKDCGNLKKS
uniref:Uncharacterized protein n=1 Tax=Panagrolaimus sp. PS1159 TaxID=55785 RepID=A0AC35EZN9_9BILA